MRVLNEEANCVYYQAAVGTGSRVIFCTPIDTYTHGFTLLHIYAEVHTCTLNTPMHTCFRAALLLSSSVPIFFLTPVMDGLQVSFHSTLPLIGSAQHHPEPMAEIISSSIDDQLLAQELTVVFSS